MTGVVTLSQLSGNPYTAYAIHCHSELLHLGFADPDIPLVSWDDRAVVAVADVANYPVGIILWQKVDWRQEASIKLGFVNEDNRRIGVYRLMYARLVEEAKALGLRSIRSAIKIDNLAAREMVKALGRQEESINTVHWL